MANAVERMRGNAACFSRLVRIMGVTFPFVVDRVRALGRGMRSRCGARRSGRESGHTTPPMARVDAGDALRGVGQMPTNSNVGRAAKARAPPADPESGTPARVLFYV